MDLLAGSNPNSAKTDLSEYLNRNYVRANFLSKFIMVGGFFLCVDLTWSDPQTLQISYLCLFAVLFSVLKLTASDLHSLLVIVQCIL